MHWQFNTPNQLMLQYVSDYCQVFEFAANQQEWRALREVPSNS